MYETVFDKKYFEMKVIFSALSGRQQHILTSATRLDPLPDLLPFKKAETLNYLREEAESKLKLKLVHTKSIDKVETLMRLVAGFNQEVCLVFCNHRESVERTSTMLKEKGIVNVFYHGAMEQQERDSALCKFRNALSPNHSNSFSRFFWAKQNQAKAER